MHRVSVRDARSVVTIGSSLRQRHYHSERNHAPVPPIPVTHAPELLSKTRVRAAYSEGAGIYRLIPQAVAVPRSVGEVRALVRWAAKQRLALVPRGAGSGMPGGNVGRGIVTDLSQGFNDIAVDPRRRVARVGASVTGAQLAAAIQQYDLRLPPDPSSSAFATSGGFVATNAAGPRSVRYGSVRRWVEGVEIVGADGEARWVRRGGGSGDRFQLDAEARECVSLAFPQTRKNSSAYALDAFAASGDELDLIIGSEGTLGIVTAVEWRLDPVPPHRAGLALGFATLEALGDAVPYLLQLEPTAVELLDRTLLDFVADEHATMPPALAGVLLVDFERPTAAAARGAVGDAARGLRESAVHVDTALTADELDRLWRIRRLASPALARLPETRRSLQVIEDGCVPPQRLAAYIAGLREASARYGIELAIFGHAGDGHVHVNALPDMTRPDWREALAALLNDVSALLVSLGGTASGEHGDGRLRAGLAERFLGPAAMALLREVKRAYDVDAVFNPGVIIPAPDWAPLADLKVGPEAASIPEDIAARLRAVERGAEWALPKTGLAD